MFGLTKGPFYSDRNHQVYLALADIKTIADISIKPDSHTNAVAAIVEKIYFGLPTACIVPVAVPLVAHVGVDIVLCSSDHPTRELIPVLLEEQTRKFLLVQWLPRLLAHDFTLQLHNKCFSVRLHNSARVPKEANLVIKPGDVLTFGPIATSSIAAGGHHRPLPPPTLHAQATVLQRCEFAVNTAGWMASDELEAVMQWILWTAPSFAAFAGPALWDTTTDAFRQGNLFETTFRNAPRAIMPVLTDSHWTSIEILRSRNVIQVTLFGFPFELFSRVQRIVASILDMPVSNLDFRDAATDSIPHMCGWQLAARWLTESNLRDSLPDTGSGLLTLHPVCRDIVQEVLQDSVIEWTAINVPDSLIQLALQLRQNFFVHLCRDMQPTSVVCQSTLVSSAVTSTEPAVRSIIPRVLSNDPTHLPVRLRHLGLTPAWLASDELDLLLNLPRASVPTVYFPPPGKWCPIQHAIVPFGSHVSLHAQYPSVCWLVLVQDHWIQIEIIRNGYQTLLLHSQFGSYSPVIQEIRGFVARELSLPVEDVQCLPELIRAEQHLCGWRLVHNIYIKHGLQLNAEPGIIPALLNVSPCTDRLAQILHDAEQTWQSHTNDRVLLHFASAARAIFLRALHEGRRVPHYQAGGAKDQKDANQEPDRSQQTGNASGSASKAKDPLWEQDPWARKTKTVPTRWEELILPQNHPFVDEQGKAIVQTHRLQAVHTKQGLTLTTKSNLGDMLRITTNKTFALILPMTDLTSYGDVAGRVQGPFEVVLSDTNMQTCYKRIVQLLVVHGTVKFQLPTPSHKFTADEHIEIVLELDSRLVSSKDLDAVKEQPISKFRKLVEPACGTAAAAINLYGFRVGRHPSSGKGDTQLQCIAQVPKSARAGILAYSGTHSLLTRDFLDKGAVSTDTTILPRFWEATCQGLREALIIVKQTEGAVGLVLARRGLAVRCWTSQIAEARATVLASDNRITPDNIGIVPKHVRDSTGWPPAVEPKHVVSAVLSATSHAPVPMRAFRVAGVHGWSLAFETLPKLETFTVEINGRTYQILLAESQPSVLNRTSKPLRNNRAPAKQSAQIPPPPLVQTYPTVQHSVDTQRLDKLEQRIEVLDQRQNKFEHRIDSRFDEVSSMLRQLVNQGSSRERSPTGSTPPAKQGRVS